MAVTVIHCENCDLYYGRSVEKCTYCNRNLVTYRADGKWTKEYFDLDSKAKNGDRNAEGLRRGVVNRSNRELNKGEQEGRHKEQLKSQENINETLKKLLETVENMDMTAATEDVADETLVCDDNSSVSEAQADARHTTMMNGLQGVDESIKLMCQSIVESNRGIERALDNVNANLQSVTELLKRSAESRNENADAEWSLVQDD